MKTESVDIWVDGVPAPQGSKSAYVRAGRAVIVEGASKSGRAKHAAWRKAVKDAVVEQAVEFGPRKHLVPFVGPVSVTILFLLPRPKSSRDLLGWVPKRPDLDKLCRSTLDACTDAGVWEDDSQVSELHAEKHYGDANGARITIRSLT